MKKRVANLDEITIAELQEGMRSGEITASSVVEIYRGRIEEIDRHGPAVNSIIELNPDAPAIAVELDRERMERGARGPLHGIPVIIKDNISTADRMMTTAGSLALVGAEPPADSFVVQKLRQAGAVILGKSNLSEWANFRSTQSTSGWSARGGLTRNPYALDRNTSGSSSGSAAAVSSNLAAVAVGTETDGSIVSPAAMNGLVGMKPTVGLVSRTGIVPISRSQDTAGPMCRTVSDTATLLGVIAGVDPDDDATGAGEGRFHADYTQFLDAKGLEGARIGVVRSYFGFSPPVDRVTSAALDVLEQKGAVLIDPVEIGSIAQLEEAEQIVLQYEFKAGMREFLNWIGPSAPVRSLSDIIEFNEKHRDAELRFFGQDIFLQSEARGPLTNSEYLDALARCRRLSRADGIDALVSRYHLDALVAPTNGPAWLTDLVNGDHYIGGSAGVAAVAGYPSITVPAGSIFGLPVGISFFGPAWSEPALIRIAYGFEQATRARTPPRFLETADLSAAIELTRVLPVVPG